MNEDQLGLSKEQLSALERLANNRGQLDSDRRALVEELGKKYNIPMPPIPSKMSQFGEAAKVAILPMAGQLAGAGVGAMSGNPALVVAGEIAGGLVGTKANEMFGISRPDLIDYTASAGAPLLGATLKLGKRLIPGGSAAEQQIGVERLTNLPKTLEGSKEATDTAYARIGEAPLKMPNFSATVQTLLGTESTMKKYGIHNPTVNRAMKQTATTLADNPDGIPITEVRNMLKRYREKVAGLETKGGEQYGAYKALRKAIFDDLDAAAESGVGEGAILLRQAINTARKQIVKAEFSDLVAYDGIKTVTVGTQTFDVIQPTKLLNKLRDIDFAASVGPKEFSKIETTL